VIDSPPAGRWCWPSFSSPGACRTRRAICHSSFSAGLASLPVGGRSAWPWSAYSSSAGHRAWPFVVHAVVLVNECRAVVRRPPASRGVATRTCDGAYGAPRPVPGHRPHRHAPRGGLSGMYHAVLKETVAARSWCGISSLRAQHRAVDVAGFVMSDAAPRRRRTPRGRGTCTRW